MNDLSMVRPETAQVPESYSAAKTALQACESIDECKDWADRAAALASYARQAEDDDLMNMATRIRGRAVRRAGELLKQIEPGKPGPKLELGTGSDTQLSRKDAAEQAGMSKRQQMTAVRVANVPAEQFESLVEAREPATVTKLAEIGAREYEPATETVARMMAGRNVEDYQACRDLLRTIGAYARALADLDLDKILPNLTDHERREVHESMMAVDSAHARIKPEIV